MPKLIYIVDDEPNIRQLAALGLQDEGFATKEFSNGSELMEAIERKMPDAVLLDWMMPPPDGRMICRMLRDNEITRHLSIVMLTARSDEIDKIIGLEFGADDYITKPFSVRELGARMRAILRRGQYSQSSGDIISCSRLVVDLSRRSLLKDGNPIELTMKEFDLLAMLMRNKGKVLTRDVLLDKVWGMEYFGDTRTVDVHVRYLRQKIEDESEKPIFIQTLRGVGYRFADE